MKTIHEFITNIVRDEMHMGDIDIRLFRNTKINNFRGKSDASDQTLCRFRSPLYIAPSIITVCSSFLYRTFKVF